MSNAVSSKITGKEYPLSKIFSSDFEYHNPGYQRPYAWTEDETGDLFNDLYGFFQTENTENFFLGSIVLIKDEQDRYADVIDGQQRLTTLSILFAVLADTFDNEDYKVDCKKYLQEKGNVLEGIEAQPRLFLKEKDQPFFHKYIQNIQLDALGQLDPALLDTEAKLHIQKNCAVLRKSFAEMFSNDDDRLRFTQFLLTCCYLVVVSTPSQESAFRIFTVMNSRGLDLLPTDIIKSTVIGSLPKEKQQEYTEKWEGLEELTGRDGFNEVFTHTRTIFVKERQKKKGETTMNHTEHSHHNGGCPGSRVRMMKTTAQEEVPATSAKPVSRLAQWPVQIKLVPVNAPFFDGAKLLIAADCTAYAYGNFHEEFMKGKVTLIGCPKLDAVDYTEKLTQIIRNNNIQSVTILRMEVPCCGGIQNAAQQALQASGKFIPWQVVTISTDGKIID